MAGKPNYGIDAPGVIRNLMIAGVALVGLTVALPQVTIGHINMRLFPGFLYSGGLCILSGALMLLYAKVGKFKHRDRMLAKVPWTGAEAVLDVGTGRGLLLIGAAKRLTTGHATGIDIWNAEDLSGNGPEALLANIALEGVQEKATVKSEDARQMSFPDASFDVVLSNLCIHNIYNREGRRKACLEIARVLNCGGVAVISDYKHVRDYARVFAEAGLLVNLHSPDWLRTYPPLRIVVARKNA
jgi:SAM-dependent methyltransferase